MKGLKFHFNNCGGSGNCGSDLTVKNGSFVIELFLSLISFAFIIPFIILMMVYGSNVCDFHKFVGFLFFLPGVAFAGLIDFNNLNNMFMLNLCIAFSCMLIQFLINTFAFIKFIFNRGSRDSFFIVSLFFIVINYIMVVLFLLYFMSDTSCSIF